jgi:hypothetical protein
VARPRPRLPPGGTALVLAGAAGLAVLLVVLRLAGADVIRLTGDPATSAGFGVSTGMFSIMGLLVFAAGAGACVVAALVLQGHDVQRFRFFLATAALIAIVTLDDAFLLHEQVGPDKIGIPQPLIYLALGGVTAAWAVFFRDELLDSDVPVLICCAVGFGGSLFLDVIEAGDVAEPNTATLEEWLKLWGIFALAVWCFAKARDALRLERGDGGDREAPTLAGAAGFRRGG